MHRLSSSEYNATVQDVLGTKLEPATANWRGGELGGFDNIASVLSVDEAQYDRYFETARALAVELMASESQRARFTPCVLSTPGCVRSSIERAGLRIFRRPLEPSELLTYERVYQTARGLGDDESDAFTLSLSALLSSAEFLYRIELDPEPDASEPHSLNAFELASRLSYFLWSSAPDDALLQVAAAGELSSPAQVQAAVDRLLDDPKSERFISSFAGQWLGARQVLSHPTLPRLYDWTPDVARAAGQEMLLYFEDFLRSDRSWFEFPLSDFNYADRILAKFYAIPVKLPDFGPLERLEFHEDQRAGFFGLAGFLAISSFDRRTSPSKRGDWIARRLLCAELPKPPPDVPQLDSETEDTSTLNVRQRLERHRVDPGCAACHALFDPYGLALEQFGPIGLYRSSYEDGTPVDASATLDERSEFIYDHVEERTFTAESSSLKGGPCPEYHAAQHGPGDAFATITWWNVGKVAELCRKLDAIEEAPGVSVLDNTVVLFAGCMEGGSHRANDLPVALIGGTGLGLKTDQHLVLENRPLRDLYFTLMNQVFALNVADFGQNLTQVPASAIESLV